MKKTLQSSESVWNWRETTIKRPSSRRGRALIQSSITIAIALLLIFVFDHLLFGTFVSFIAAVILTSGFFFPSFYNHIEGIGRILSRSIGLGLTWFLLVPFFYLVFFPARLILKLRGKDPMRRAWEKGKDSYWFDRTEIPDIDYYRRQY